MMCDEAINCGGVAIKGNNDIISVIHLADLLLLMMTITVLQQNLRED